MDFSLLGINVFDEKYGKMYRIMSLQQGEERLVLPVTPWKYSVQTEQNNKIVDILDFGENLIFGNTKLKKLKVSCFLPQQNHRYTFVVGDDKSPEECIDLITKWKESKVPVRAIITESAVNLMVGIDSFDYREKDGSRDVYFEMQLIESRDWNVPPANYTKQVDETTGLKERVTTGIESVLQSNWVKNAFDILDKSKYAYGNFGSLETFKSQNGLSRLATKLSGWSW